MDRIWNLLISSVILLTSLWYTLAAPKQELTYELCDTDQTHVIQIKSLSVKPHPIVIPGFIKMAASFDVKEDIHGPVQMDIKLHRHQRDDSWKSVPCTEFGILDNCTFDNVCKEANETKIECDQHLIDAGLDCKCPILAGEYNIQDVETDALMLIIEQELLVEVRLTTNTTTLLCIQIDLVLKPFRF